MTNATGGILDDQDFLPFGTVAAGGISGSDNKYRFVGKEHDNESNYDYFGARYYYSTMGRWLTPDWSAAPTTVPYADFSDPQSLNLYSYVRNSPTFRADKDGHWDYYDHDMITRLAYGRAKLAYNNNVNLANQRTDTGGQKFNSLGMHREAHEQNYAPYAQRSHFLLSAGESQSTAYNHAISQFEANANVARSQLQAHANADSTIGAGLHQVQDAFAHTSRNDNGEITHIQCYNCGSNADHHHPDSNIYGVLLPEANAAVEASKDYLLLMNSAASMTDAQFADALKAFEDKYLAASDTVKNDNTPKEYKK